ncbi:MAG TPA: TolC family protein, partial [Bacteroidia bacterium]|nr:TolC family protein [Bacteroidia bacterium]
MKRSVLFLLLAVCSLAVNAQMYTAGGPFTPAVRDSVDTWPKDNLRPWSLQECIAYAQVHNIQVQLQELNVRMSETNLRASQGQLLPNLNAGATHTYQYGQTVDRFTNTFVNDRVLNQNFFVSSNYTVFAGMQNYNTVQQNKYSLEASQFGVDQMRYDISMNVANAYLNILFTQDQVEIAKRQQALTQAQVDRTLILVDAGASARGILLDLQTQLALETVTTVTAENNVVIAYLTLTQLMNLDTTEGFTIIRPDLPLPGEGVLAETPQQIYLVAEGTQPAIKQADANIKSAEKGVDVAQGALSPTLSLQGSLGTGYSGAAQSATATPNGADTVGITTGGDFVLVPGFDYNYATVPFSEQLDNNFNQSFGLQLTIPIFNRLQVSTNIQRAQIQYQNAQLNADLARQNLDKNIQQAHADAKAALEKYRAQEAGVTAAKEAFKYTEERFNV